MSIHVDINREIHSHGDTILHDHEIDRSLTKKHFVMGDRQNSSAITRRTFKLFSYGMILSLTVINELRHRTVPLIKTNSGSFFFECLVRLNRKNRNGARIDPRGYRISMTMKDTFLPIDRRSRDHGSMDNLYFSPP